MDRRALAMVVVTTVIVCVAFVAGCATGGSGRSAERTGAMTPEAEVKLGRDLERYLRKTESDERQTTPSAKKLLDVLVGNDVYLDNMPRTSTAEQATLVKTYVTLPRLLPYEERSVGRYLTAPRTPTRRVGRRSRATNSCWTRSARQTAW